jgi:hypothetical protein
MPTNNFIKYMNSMIPEKKELEALEDLYPLVDFYLDEDEDSPLRIEPDPDYFYSDDSLDQFEHLRLALLQYEAKEPPKHKEADDDDDVCPF